LQESGGGETCPLSTGIGVRSVHLVREGRGERAPAGIARRMRSTSITTLACRGAPRAVGHEQQRPSGFRACPRGNGSKGI